MCSTACPLCHSAETEQFHQDKNRLYRRCSTCQLTFVPKEFHLSANAEKAQYDLHQNSPADEGYRRFLSRVCIPVAQRIKPGSRGLDFGSGPGPTLSGMFCELGHNVQIYDPFYAVDDSILNSEYDFVTATEVVEHFREPRIELEKIWNCVGAGSVLGIMTKLAQGQIAFSNWHYKNDLTHVSFFSRPTFEWLAGQWKSELQFIGNDVMVFQK